MRFQGKEAIVTGPANGMGAAEAKIYARKGVRVVAKDVNEEKLMELAAEIKAAGGEISALKHNVASEEEWKAVFAKTVEAYGQIDVLVNNAGEAINKNFATTEMEKWNWVSDINLNGCVLGMKYAIPEMQKAGGGSVINI